MEAWKQVERDILSEIAKAEKRIVELKESLRLVRKKPVQDVRAEYVVKAKSSGTVPEP
jgi:hypothetical protein